MADAPNGKMTPGRLRMLLDSYGAATGRWPAQERAAALALIESSDAARAAYREAARHDELLDRMPEAELSPALAQRMAALPLPRAGLIARLTRAPTSAPRIVWQGAVAAAAIMGIAVGMTLSALVLDPPARGGSAVTIAESGDAARPGDIFDGEGGEAGSPEIAVLGLTGDGDGGRDILEIPVT